MQRAVDRALRATRQLKQSDGRAEARRKLSTGPDRAAGPPPGAAGGGVHLTRKPCQLPRCHQELTRPHLWTCSFAFQLPVLRQSELHPKKRVQTQFIAGGRSKATKWDTVYFFMRKNVLLNYKSKVIEIYF